MNKSIKANFHHKIYKKKTYTNFPQILNIKQKIHFPFFPQTSNILAPMMYKKSYHIQNI